MRDPHKPRSTAYYVLCHNADLLKEAPWAFWRYLVAIEVVMGVVFFLAQLGKESNNQFWTVTAQWVHDNIATARWFSWWYALLIPAIMVAWRLMVANYTRHKAWESYCRETVEALVGLPADTVDKMCAAIGGPSKDICGAFLSVCGLSEREERFDLKQAITWVHVCRNHQGNPDDCIECHEDTRIALVILGEADFLHEWSPSRKMSLRPEAELVARVIDLRSGDTFMLPERPSPLASRTSLPPTT